jgi:phage gpG-like protein
VSLTGDFGALSKLIAQLAGADRIPRELREPLAKRALELTRASYRRGTDPMGRTWDALATGARATLHRDGKLYGSLAYQLTGDGFELTADAVYAAIHNYGGNAGRNQSVKIPKRQYLPDGDAMPYAWERAFEQICDRYVREHFA